MCGQPKWLTSETSAIEIERVPRDNNIRAAEVSTKRMDSNRTYENKFWPYMLGFFNFFFFKTKCFLSSVGIVHKSGFVYIIIYMIKDFAMAKCGVSL